MQLEFIAIGQDLKRIDHNVPRANSQNYLTAKFTLPDDYDGIITAHFRMIINRAMYETSATVINGLCKIPDEVNKPGDLYVGITGTGVTHIPTNFTAVQIFPSCDDDQMYPLPGMTTSQYQETVEMYNKIMEYSGGQGGGTLPVNGKSIEFTWQGTSLGIRQEGQTTYQFVDLKGNSGYTPIKGVDYFDGNPGYTPIKGTDYFDGEPGANGLGAYQLWLNQGNVGTVTDFINSLKGATPLKGVDYFTTGDVDNIVLQIIDNIYNVPIISPVSNVFNINFNNKSFANRTVNITDSVAKTMSISNIPVVDDGVELELYLVLVYTSTAAITWFNNISWAGGSAPTLTVGKIYRISFFSIDGGLTWQGYASGGV